MAKSKLRDIKWGFLGLRTVVRGWEVTNHVTILPLGDVIRDSAVQLGLTHQRGAIGVDSSTRPYLKW
jgi:hypothetical protein